LTDEVTAATPAATLSEANAATATEATAAAAVTPFSKLDTSQWFELAAEEKATVIKFVKSNWDVIATLI
jgi:hypothetical protein